EYVPRPPEFSMNVLGLESKGLVPLLFRRKQSWMDRLFAWFAPRNQEEAEAPGILNGDADALPVLEELWAQCKGANQDQLIIEISPIVLEGLYRAKLKAGQISIPQNRPPISISDLLPMVDGFQPE